MHGPGIPPGPWDPGPLCDAAIAHPGSQSEFAPQAFQVELKKAVKDFRREWLVVVCLLATAIVVAALMAYLAISLQRHDLQQLMAQKNKLSAEVNALQEQADQARRNNGRKAPK